MNLMQTVRVGNMELGAGQPKICVPITGKNKEEILSQVKLIKEAAPDLVEWRGDIFEDIMDMSAAEEVLKEIHTILEDIPLLFTFRTAKEGGSREISLENYITLNLQMAESDYISLIDVEVYMGCDSGQKDMSAADAECSMQPLVRALQKKGKAVIGSHHRFDCTPSKEQMVDVLKHIEEVGADVLKLAVMPLDNEDVELLLQVTNEAVCIRVNHPVVTMSMGALGVKSRICGEIYGSAMTFACVGKASAPGQMEIGDLRNAMQEVHKIVEKF